MGGDTVARIFKLPGILLRHPRLTTLAAGIVTFFMLESFIHVESDRRLQIELNVVQAHVSSVRATLESELNASLSLSLGLSTFVLTNPTYTDEQFDQVAASLMHIRPGIRSVAMAPDNIIRNVYPLEGNEKALGLRYLDSPTQKDAVLRLMREQRPVIAGPVELVQGGLGLINRIPILFTQQDGTKRYWGLASVAVDPTPIFEKAGISGPTKDGLEFAMRGRDGLGADGEVFLGDPALFHDPHAVLMDIFIPGGSWQMAARPANMAATYLSNVGTLPLQIFAGLLALVVAGMAHATLMAHRRMRAMALKDSLTGLANRHQFNIRGQALFTLAKRSGRALTLLNMDLNDFKLVNDSYGHDVGDQLLIHVANQLRKCFRESDLLARVGGDEFLALLPDTAMDSHLEVLLHRIRDAVSSPLPVISPELRAKISIGVASYSQATPAFDDLLREADDAMYKEKVSEKYGVRRH